MRGEFYRSKLTACIVEYVENSGKLGKIICKPEMAPYVDRIIPDDESDAERREGIGNKTHHTEYSVINP